MGEHLATVHEMHPVQHPDIKEVNAGLVQYELDKHKEAIQSATARQEAITKVFGKNSVDAA